MTPIKIIEVRSLDGDTVRIRVYDRGIVIERGQETRAYIGGVAVPDWMVEKAPNEIDPHELFCLKDPEVIGRLVVKLGPRHILSTLNGKIVDRRHHQLLIIFDDAGKRRAYLRRGWFSGSWRLEEIDGSIQTVKDARAWQSRCDKEKRERERKWRGLH